MKACKYCGRVLEEDEKKCPGCGSIEMVDEKVVIPQPTNSEAVRVPGSAKRHKGGLWAVLIAMVAVVSLAFIIIPKMRTAPPAIQTQGNANAGSADGSEPITNKESDLAYEAAQIYIEQKDYPNALQKLGVVSSKSKHYDEAQLKLIEISGTYKSEMTDKVDTLLAEKKYPEALTTLNTALQILKDDPALIIKLQTVHKTKIITKLAEFDKAQDVASAIKYLETEMKNVQGDTELSVRLDTYKMRYKDTLIADADQALEDEGYQAAVDLINAGKSVLPNDPELDSKVEEYNTYMPVSLLTLDTFNEGRNSVYSNEDGVIKDNIGNSYVGYMHSGLNTFMASMDGWSEYLINGEYSSLTGRFFLDFDVKSSSSTKLIKIFGDNALLYTASVTGGVEPIDFEVNIQGVKRLKIQLTSNGGILANIELHK